MGWLNNKPKKKSKMATFDNPPAELTKFEKLKLMSKNIDAIDRIRQKIKRLDANLARDIQFLYPNSSVTISLNGYSNEDENEIYRRASEAAVEATIEVLRNSADKMESEITNSIN